MCEFILVDSSNFNCVDIFRIWNSESENSLLVLLEINVVHFTWPKIYLGLKLSLELELAIMPTAYAQSYPSSIASCQLLSTDNTDILAIKRAPQVMLSPRGQRVAQHDVYVGVSHALITIFEYLHDQVLILAGIRVL